jgi:murein DD-endopeptidase MepM/ murein hydrolase activator NlpD
MHEVDPTFKQAKARRAERKTRIRNRRLIEAGALTLAAVATVFLLVGTGVIWIGRRPITPEEIAPAPQTETVEMPQFVPAIVDLAGDPMKISLGNAANIELTRYVPRPPTLPPDRVTSGQLAVLSDTMITTSQRFMTTLPSSPNDFALYQAQRVRVPKPEPSVTPPPGPGAPSAGGDAAFEPTSFTPNEPRSGGAAPSEPVENNSSVISVRREAVRFVPDEDYIARVLVSRSLEDELAGKQFAADDIHEFSAAMAESIGKPLLDPGDVVAVRGVRTGPGPLRIVQFSVYNSTGYIGSLARDDDGTIVVGSDPWVFDHLFNYTGNEDVADPGRQYRLLDAIYSTGARNRVPTGILGEAIMLLSRTYDLNAFASTDDRLILVYARDRGDDDGGTGRVLYVGVKGTDRSIDCYVYKSSADGDYSCFKQNSYGSAVSTSSAMVTPVRGVLTTPFGPGMDPVLKKVVVHTGVDWTAPMGTPVVAAFGGSVTSVGTRGDDGNTVVLAHSGGRETTYSHLQDFAPGLAVGAAVKPGDLIGFVGNSGVSESPSLHFELHQGGKPVDPLQTAVTVASDDSAVEVLTDRIVQVESGGVATAKNPLSSAYGVGQFINATWLRMMRTYRPDLASSMSEADLLALRTDPTISREMVANLAREGESYLKARGHQITAGRLYLCHFLGMQDAATVLATDPATPLASVLAQSVIDANPFLTGQTVGYVEDWAERKMSGKRAPAPAPVQVASPEFLIYKAAIDTALLPPAPTGVPTAAPEQPTVG